MKKLLNVLLLISTALLAYHFYSTPQHLSVSEPASKSFVKEDSVDLISSIEKAAQLARKKLRHAHDSFAISKADLWGDFELSSHPDFVRVEVKYAKHAHFYLRKAAYEAYKRMYEAAKKEGILLKIGSAGRSFIDQKNIWESKWKSRKNLVEPVKRAENILEYSAMPSTSRHHWGTDIDLNAKSETYFKTAQGKNVYAWLQKNAAKFGFYQPYTAKDKKRPYGYNEEKWHWSYMPLASKFLNFYQKNVHYEDIKGFLGSETAKELAVIEKYVFGINPDCLAYKGN